jgi:uncharacterized OB-fold protein
MVPPLTDANRAFWTGGAEGELLIQWCEDDARWVYPTAARCPQCRGQLEVRPVAGTGTLFSYTVNHQQFHPDVPPPYVIGIVTLDEQSDLRLPTNVVNCDPDVLECGMRMRVLFEENGDAFVPVFEPLT